jgi:hypothetical protein
MFTKIAQLHSIRQILFNQIARRLGEENLPPVSSCAYPRGPMNSHAHVASTGAKWFPGMKSHTYPYRDTVGPLVAENAALRSHCCFEGIFRSSECDEDRIALSIHLVPVSLFRSGAEELTIVREDLRVAVTEVLK